MARTMTMSPYLARTPIWERLGRKIDAKTSKEVLEQAHLEWKVDKFNLLTNHPANPIYNDLIVPEHQAIVRMDNSTVLGVMGINYEPIQNNEPIEMVMEIADEEGIKISHIGQFDGGKFIWANCMLPKRIKIGPEEIQMHVIVSWSHNGMYALQCTFIPVHVDTGTIFTAKVPKFSNFVKIKHTKMCLNRINETKKMIQQAFGYAEKLEETLVQMVNRPWSMKDMKSYLDEIFPSSGAKRGDKMADDKREEIGRIFEDDDTATSGTAYSAYKSIAYWTDHLKRTKNVYQDSKKQKVDEQATKENDFYSVVFDTKSALKEEAFSIISRKLNP